MMTQEMTQEDEHEVQELVLTLTNEGKLYPARLEVEKSLEQDFRAGKWADSKAAKSYGILLDQTAAQLKKQFPASKFRFGPKVKNEAAKELAQSLRAEFEIGNFHS